MELKVYRKEKTSISTIGELFVDGKFECFTLEDPIRDKKIPGETAIPTGRYKVILNLSNRFKKIMPLLLNVPNFEGVRIHTGNTPKDTEGCILVGCHFSKNWISESKKAYEALFTKLQNAKDPIYIEIE